MFFEDIGEEIKTMPLGGNDVVDDEEEEDEMVLETAANDQPVLLVRPRWVLLDLVVTTVVVGLELAGHGLCWALVRKVGLDG